MKESPPKVLLFSDTQMLEHETGSGHWEQSARLRNVQGYFEAHPVHGAQWTAVTPATRTALARVHTAAYLDHLETLDGQAAQLDPDTPISAGSIRAAKHAVGAAVAMVDAAFGSATPRGFALIRPPGHHALAGAAMGFCLFNNVAIAAAHAQAVYGCKRILIVDWDVHHGNGTQDIFEESAEVLVFNAHRAPFYPGTGAVEDVGKGAGAGFSVNVALPEAVGDGDYVAAFKRILLPIAETFCPELVLVSAGFDAHQEDPIGGMQVTDDGFASLCGLVTAIADRYANGRIGLVLEGGYNVEALTRSAAACVNVLAGHVAPDAPKAGGRADAAAAQTVAAQRTFWPL